MCISVPLIHVNRGMEGPHVTKTIAGGVETAYFDRNGTGPPAQPPDRFDDMVPSIRPVLIKQYAGRRFYRPAAGAYLTLDDLAGMVEDEEDFTVLEAESGVDITSTVLKQIIRKRALHG